MRSLAYLLFTLAVPSLAQNIEVTPVSIVRTFPSNAATPVTIAMNVTGGASGSIVTRAVTESGGNWLSISNAASGGPTALSITLEPSGLPDGTYLGAITLTLAAFTKTVPVTISIGNPGPQLPSAGIVNAASYQAGAIAPGEIVTLFGTSIGPQMPYGAKVQDGALIANLAATKVWFDNIAAPLIYAYPNQIAAVVPFEVHGKTSVRVQVENLVARTPPVILPVQEAVPAIFTADASGVGPAAASNEDGSPNQTSNPAVKGSIVVLYATGVGLMTPEVATGTLVSDQVRRVPRLPVEVIVGGQTGELLYAGQAPGLVAGALQINVRIPITTAPGAASVLLRVGRTQSQAGVTVWVK